ncbi:unnamed protein product, partial [Dicrocoelium dendriticum]
MSEVCVKTAPELPSIIVLSGSNLGPYTAFKVLKNSLCWRCSASIPSASPSPSTMHFQCDGALESAAVEVFETDFFPKSLRSATCAENVAFFSATIVQVVALFSSNQSGSLQFARPMVTSAAAVTWSRMWCHRSPTVAMHSTSHSRAVIAFSSSIGFAT